MILVWEIPSAPSVLMLSWRLGGVLALRTTNWPRACTMCGIVEQAPGNEWGYLVIMRVGLLLVAPVAAVLAADCSAGPKRWAKGKQQRASIGQQR